MDARSEGYLKFVHPDLAKIARAASQEPVAWEICYGVRTLAAEEAAVASGHSETLHSRHLASKTAGYHGLSCAFDVVHLTPATKKIDWAPGHEQTVFGEIAKQIIAAAEELKIPVEWGGSWKESTVVLPGHFHDWGHFQLPWKEYP